MKAYRKIFDVIDDSTILEVITRIQSGKHQEKKRIAPSTIVLLAAITSVLVISVSAVFHFMSNYSIPEGIFNSQRTDGSQIVQYSPNGTMSGNSTEFAAQQEWNQFQTDYLSAGKLGTPLPKEDPFREIYGLGDETQLTKLREIAEKYSLTLLDSCFIVESAENFQRHSGLTLPVSPCNLASEPWFGSVYNNGNYKLSGLRIAVGDQRIAINIFRTAKGYMTDYLLLGDALEEYVVQEYALQDDTAVTLSLGARYSMIFYESDSCYLAVSVNGGYNPINVLPLLDMTQLQAIAEAVIH